MTAKKPFLRALPTEFGLLRVSGATWAEASDKTSINVMIDDHAELCAVLLEVHPQTDRAAVPSEGSSPAALLAEVQDLVLEALTQRAPLYEVVSSTRKFCAAHAGCEVGIALMRLSQRDSRAEILNAGMPAIVWIAPDAEIVLHPALSGRIGHTPGEVHAYELCPLVWGSSWLMMSESFVLAQPAHTTSQEGTPGSERFDAQSWLSEQDVAYDAHLLARETRERLCQRMHSVDGPVPADDAALVCIAASSEPRF
ncbi:MAG TPA: SpoIIE family protein phosphatase [Polyangiaceae bacterium]|nr:SpoIIE family protein phosphatase [Polyangiaceae bacterium]